MEPISRFTPSPGQTNRGRINCAGSRCVSRTRLRRDSVARKRRRRWIGKGIHLDCNSRGTVAPEVWGLLGSQCGGRVHADNAAGRVPDGGGGGDGTRQRRGSADGGAGGLNAGDQVLQESAQRAGAGNSAQHSNGYGQHALTQQHAAEAQDRRAYGNAHADFVGAAGNGIGGCAVGSNDGQQAGETAEEEHGRSVEARSGELVAETLVECLDFVDGYLAIDLLDGVAERRQVALGVTAHAHHESGEGVLGLRNRKIEQAFDSGRRVESRVANDADDGDRLVVGRIEDHLMADNAGAGVCITDLFLIHYGNARATSTVAFGEIAAGHQACPGSLEISGSDVQRHAPNFLTGIENRLEGISRRGDERQIIGRSGGFHAGHGAQPVERPPVILRGLRIRLRASALEIDREGSHVARAQSQVCAGQFQEVAAHAHGTGYQNHSQGSLHGQQQAAHAVDTAGEKSREDAEYDDGEQGQGSAAKPRTRQSRTVYRWVEKSAGGWTMAARRQAHCATARPAVAATSVRAMLSVINCRTRRARPAPNADRIANSGMRSVIKESSRCATLAQAINRTKATTARSTSEAWRTGPASWSWSEIRRGRQAGSSWNALG